MSNYSLKESLNFAVQGEFPEDFDQWEMEDTTAGPGREGWTIAHEIARHHDLPVGLDCLDLATKNGTTVAHVLANYGVLPAGFDKWDLKDENGWTVAHEAAHQRILPEDFDRWDLVDNTGFTVAQAAAFGDAMGRMWSNEELDPADAKICNSAGWTVAHFAAAEGYLPEGFDLWHLVSNDGETVAQAAAENDTLPEDFNRWDLVPEKYRPASLINKDCSGDVLVAEFERVIAEVTQQIMLAKNFSVKQTMALAQRALSSLPEKMEEQIYNQTLERIVKGDIPAPSAWEWRLADDTGWTLAHHAAMRGLLPEGFTRWDVANNQGYSVAYAAAQNNYLPEDFQNWEWASHGGRTVAHEAVKFRKLPLTDHQWRMATKGGWTVAHEAAGYNNLPDGFDQWDLADEDGTTVAQIAAIHGNLPDDFARWDLVSDKFRPENQKKTASKMGL